MEHGSRHHSGIVNFCSIIAEFHFILDKQVVFLNITLLETQRTRDIIHARSFRNLLRKGTATRFYDRAPFTHFRASVIQSLLSIKHVYNAIIMSGQNKPLFSRIASIRFAGILFALFVFASSAIAQTGRIAGDVTVAGTDETLPGVNVIIDGLQIGAATNIDGYYSILNIPPGTYSLRASAIGFATVVVDDVRVNIDQTTIVDFEMREQAFEGEEVVVTAVRPVVERDVASSRANISSDQIESLPVSNVQQVVGLQAGVLGGSIRGLGAEYSQWSLGGVSLRDERDNTPYNAVSLVSVSEVQVQTGGFNAEHGNVQSGIVNIVTREGSRDRYSADVIFRYRPPGKKHFGNPVNHPDSYFMRSYLDDEVAWTGTGTRGNDDGPWDDYTLRQYREFEGWIAAAEREMSPASPYYGLSPAAAQQVFLWQKRKDFAITEPDFDLDMGFGGPFPFLSEQLGNLRFWAAHRRTQEMYLFPLSRDRYEDYSTHIKLTSDLIQGRGMKLSIESLFGSQTGSNSNNSGLPGIFRSAAGIAAAPSRHSYQDGVIFSSDYFAPTRVDRFVLGAKFTHSISSDTFYEIQVSNFSSSYDTNPSPLRSGVPALLGEEWAAYGQPGNGESRIFGNNYVANEAPFGFMPLPSDGIGDSMRMGVGMSNSRDSSSVSYFTADFDITSQINRYLQVKSGLEFVRTRSQVNYSRLDEYLPSQNMVSKWDKRPLRGGVYTQARLDFEGMVANVGLRLDYSYANTTWYDFDPFNPALGSGNFDELDDLLEQRDTDHHVFLSPRIGISFPITVESKLFFNYGHFRSMPTPENLYLVRQGLQQDRVERIANPNLPLPQTVSYELGYEHNILENYLLRVAGFYSDITNHSELVTYTSTDQAVQYAITQPNRYRDHRGIEATLERRGGRFFRGFVNYTYTVTSTGRFDFFRQFESPAEQRRYERTTGRDHNDQLRPVARPYARASLDFFTPAGFGPDWGAMRPLESWRINLLGTWRAGHHFTWAGGGAAPTGIVNNVQWRDFYNLELRISREFEVAGTRIQFFMDMDNVLNTRRMSPSYGFSDGEDYNRYMRSLHLPESVLDELSYAAVPGSDRPGDFRRSGVDFVPIEPVATLNDVERPNERALYFDTRTREYFQYYNGVFLPADEEFVQQVLDDKAYIEMPNHTFFTFLNPRNIYWGIRVRF